jgi:hypothetical protein
MPFGLGTVRKDPVRNRSEIRSALTRFLLVGLSSLVLVAAPTVLLFNHIARDHGLETAMESGQNVTIRRLAPETTSAVIAGEPARPHWLTSTPSSANERVTVRLPGSRSGP